MQNTHTNKDVFLGNGTELNLEKIKALFGDFDHISETIPPTCSIEQVGITGFAQWNKSENLSKQLSPLYWKDFKLN